MKSPSARIAMIHTIAARKRERILSYTLKRSLLGQPMKPLAETPLDRRHARAFQKTLNAALAADPKRKPATGRTAASKTA